MAFDVSLAPTQSFAVSNAPATFVLPASFAQQRLWFLDRFEPNNPVYNIPLSLRLVGNLNVLALERALNEIVRRHEILRTTFIAEHNEPAQVVHPFVPFSLAVTSLENSSAENIRAHVTHELQRAFDLKRGPLWRAQLLRVNEAEHILVFTIHHIIFDGWSRDIFLRELGALYDAFARGQNSPLAEPEIQYADFAVWQREWLQGEVLERELDFWRKQLRDAPPLVELPSDFSRPAVQTYRGAHETFSISQELTGALEAMSRRAGASLFMTLLAAFQVLLYRYTGQADIVVGAPIANRNRHEIENVIGFFVNTLVIRSRVSDPLPFETFLAQVRQTALDAYAHQDVPFEKLVEALQPARTLAYPPWVQVAINYLESNAADFKLGDVRAEWAPSENKTTKFDLMLNITHTANDLRGHVEYSTDLFERATIARLLEHFQVLLNAIVDAPATPIGKLALITERERKQLLMAWNDTATDYPQQTLEQLFETQVTRTPNDIALVFESERVTFRELNTRANQLAHQLVARGVRSETIVGIKLPRSPQLVVALLAILKAGGAYLVLDTNLPHARLRALLDDARPQILITNNLYQDKLPARIDVVNLDRDAETIARACDANPNLASSLDTLAYILYTSGSTGQPKGVMGLHRGIVNRLAWMWRNYPYGRDEVCAQKTSLNFVDSIAEIFSPLLQGIPLVILSDEQVRDANLFVQTLAKHRITRLTLVPSHLRTLLHSSADWNALKNLRLVICSGEALDTETARMFYGRFPHATLLNLYGSTEVAADSLCFEIPRDALSERVPIGKPLANTQAYVLNHSLESAPVGVVGELYLGGAGLARGYLHHPEWTAEKFMPNPFDSQLSSRLYRTGDLARVRADGNIEYVGRADRQIQVRGMRVELDEIENVLRAHPRVQDASVVLYETRIVAFFVADENAETLRAYLMEHLPAHMLPATFIPLNEMPRTATGKIDRRALAAQTFAPTQNIAPVLMPRDALETKLQTIWQRVLNVPNVGVTDDFFELGGHSLLAIVLFGEMERELGENFSREKLPLATLFQAPTIEKLAREIRSGTSTREWTPVIAIQPKGNQPPFFCVHGFGGGVIGYAQLARLLGDDQPFYGLQARGQEEDVPPDATIEAMATRYVSAIRERQPHGPYYLGGYCYGGTVALEMAQQLVAQGERVNFLGMFENPAPKSQYRRFKPTVQNTQRLVKNLPYWAGDFLALGWKHKWRRLEREVKQRAYHRTMRSAVAPNVQVDLRDVLDDVAPVPQRHQRLIQVHIGAMIRYQPQNYAGRVTVFRTRRQPLLCSHDPNLGWKELASQVDVRIVSGSHHNLLEAPFVESLARELRASLELAQGL